MLWGIDSLLTYHYLVAEYFTTTQSRTHQTDALSKRSFFNLSRSRQAELVWEALFVERTPLSEACRGVLTVLNRLGLVHYARDGNLQVSSILAIAMNVCIAVLVQMS
jgi:hypothetical protein